MSLCDELTTSCWASESDPKLTQRETESGSRLPVHVPVYMSAAAHCGTRLLSSSSDRHEIIKLTRAMNTPIDAIMSSGMDMVDISFANVNVTESSGGISATQYAPIATASNQKRKDPPPMSSTAGQKNESD